MQISRETQAVSRAAFNIPLFIAEHAAFAERARKYTSIKALAEDFSSTSQVYTAALRFFGQELVPASIVIGRKQVDGVTGSIPVAAVDTTYTLTINGVALSVELDANATAPELVANLKTAFNGSGITGISFVDNLDGSFDVSVTTPGAAWSITSSKNITLVNDASTETWVDAIAAVERENNEWIALTAATHLDDDILAIAGAVEAREKIYVTSTSSAAVKTSATTDIGSKLKALGYQKTALMWKADADTAFPECAWVGGQIQPTPGSNTWAYKQLTGTATDNLSGTETANLIAKNVNTYENIGGVNATTSGKMAGGEYIDVMLGVLWLTARIRERYWFRLVNTPKIAYTNAGIAILEADLRAQLQEGIRNNFLTDSPAPVIYTPDALNVDPNLRALRTLEDLKFEAYLAGAIHFVRIQGSVFV